MKGRGKKINYAEVESDEDLDDQQKQLERIKREDNGKRKGGDTYGTTQGGQRKKRKTARNSKQLGGAGGEPEYNSKLLLDLPFDLFVEVCSHFDGKDLLALAQVNKGIRHILLSKEARSVWSALRRKLGYALPNGMNEVGFALMVHSEKCQVCGKAAADQNLTVFLRSRFCRKCFKAHTVSSKGLKKAWPDLHSLASQCVRYVDQGKHWRRDEPRPLPRFGSASCRVVNELKELEEEDETAISLLENLRSKGTSTRTRRSNEVVEEVAAGKVESYVKEKNEWVKVEQKASQKYCKNLKRLESETADEASARRQAVRDFQVATAETLKDDYDWKDDERDYLLRWGLFEKLAPKATVAAKPEAWSKCRQQIRTRIEEEAARQAQLQAQNTRSGFLRPYYDSFTISKDNKLDIFPHFDAFLQFKSIRPLWKPDDATIDDEIWRELRSDVYKDLDKYREEARIEAVRYILAANQGLSSTSSLSKDPADYPESTYDENFFSRMTSLFCTWNWQRPGRRILVNPYPQTIRDGWFRGIGHLQKRIDSRTVLIVRSLVEAAGLDPETATYDDFEELEHSFVWVNDPRKSYRRRLPKRYWLDLIPDAVEKGPSKRKIAQGEGFEFEYRPQDESEDRDSESSSSEEGDEDEESEGEGGSGEGEGESGGEEEEDGSENGDDRSDDEEE